LCVVEIKARNPTQYSVWSVFKGSSLPLQPRINLIIHADRPGHSNLQADHSVTLSQSFTVINVEDGAIEPPQAEGVEDAEHQSGFPVTTVLPLASRSVG
jgi:hypothetical protein